MISYSLTLPLSPTINTYYGSAGNRRYIKPAGVAFRQEVALLVRLQKLPKLTGKLWISMRVCPRDKRVQDIDNRAKALLDALMHAGLFEDDSQVDYLEIKRGSVVSGGRIELLIGEVEETMTLADPNVIDVQSRVVSEALQIPTLKRVANAP